MRLLGISGTAAAIAIAAAANASDQDCDRYAALDRLPDRFEEIASGDFGEVELFILSDGKCTCANTPAVNRRLDKPAPQNVNWSCRMARPDERRSD